MHSQKRWDMWHELSLSPRKKQPSLARSLTRRGPKESKMSKKGKRSARQRKLFALREQELIDAMKAWVHVSSHRGTESIENEVAALGDLSFAAYRAMKLLLPPKTGN
jgi:hypothetical protein